MELWPGQMRYPIKFSKSFMKSLLTHFKGGQVAVGASFDGPPPGSSGEFIQHELNHEAIHPEAFRPNSRLPPRRQIANLSYRPAFFQISETRAFTSSGILSTSGHSRVNPSPGHLRVASIPILLP